MSESSFSYMNSVEVEYSLKEKEECFNQGRYS